MRLGNNNEFSVLRISPKEASTRLNGLIRMFRQLDVWANGRGPFPKFSFGSSAHGRRVIQTPTGQNLRPLPRF